MGDMDLDAFRERARADARKDHDEKVAAGKCAKTPGGLLGPSCGLEREHDGRCDWGAFFEPDGSFHAVDPNAPYPTVHHSFGMLPDVPVGPGDAR